MPKLTIRCMLFVSSYFPLTLIFCFFLFEKQRLWAISVFFVGLLGLVTMLVYFLLIAPKKVAFHEKITGLQRRDGEIMSYIASYLIPFVTFPLDGLAQIGSLLVFLFVLSVIYVTSNMIYINPMLNLFGYHLYEVTFENSELSHYLITRQEVILGKTVQVAKIGNGAFLETRM